MRALVAVLIFLGCGVIAFLIQAALILILGETLLTHPSAVLVIHVALLLASVIATRSILGHISIRTRTGAAPRVIPPSRAPRPAAGFRSPRS